MQNYHTHLLAEVKLTYQLLEPRTELVKICSSKAAEQLLRKHWDHDLIEVKEQFKVLYLNRANRVIAWEEHSTGGQHSTVADVRIIMSTALQCLATSLILAHNHPSGNLRPSLADERLTKKISEAAKLFDICLLDHLILTREGYYSFLDEGKV